MNRVEKAIAEKANLELVFPGERVLVEPSAVYVSRTHALSVIHSFHAAGFDQMNFHSKVIFQQPVTKQSNEWATINQFCDKHKLSLVDRIDEEAYEERGTVVAGIGQDIHLFAAAGAVPLLVTPTALAHCLGTGKVEVSIPESVYIEINGAFEQKAGMEKVCDALLHYFHDSLVGFGVIIGGSAIERLDSTSRQLLTRFIPKSKAALGILSPSGPLGQVESVIKIDADQLLTFFSRNLPQG